MELVRREVLRFVRQRSRVVAAIGTPVLLWVLLGSGFARGFGETGIGEGDGATPGGYGAYLAPGMATMVVVFGAVFAAISLIEDRQTGFLRSVLISPIPTWTIVSSKILSASMLSAVQALPVLAAGPLLMGTPVTIGGVAGVLGALAAVSIGVSGLSLALAWRINSVAGFHGVMNLVLMPMWLLSGVFFSVGSASAWLGWVMRVNPLTWPTEAMRVSMMGEGAAGAAHPAWLVWTLTVVWSLAGLAGACAVIARGRYRGSAG